MCVRHELHIYEKHTLQSSRKMWQEENDTCKQQQAGLRNQNLERMTGRQENKMKTHCLMLLEGKVSTLPQIFYVRYVLERWTGGTAAQHWLANKTAK